MLVLMIFSQYFTKAYSYGPNTYLTDAVPMGDNILLTLTDGSGRTYAVSLDSLGRVDTALLTGTATIRDLRPAPGGDVWGITDSTVAHFFSSYVVEIAFGAVDTPISFQPFGGSNLLLLGFRGGMWQEYRLLARVDSSRATYRVLGITPDPDYLMGDVAAYEGDSSFIVAVAEDSTTFYVFKVERDGTTLSVEWARQISLSGGRRLFSGTMRVVPLPDGYIVVAHTVVDSGRARWGYALLNGDGNLLRALELYPISYRDLNHYLRGVVGLGGGKFALYGSVSMPSSKGAVVVVDTSGSIEVSYAITSTYNVAVLWGEPYGYALFGNDSSDGAIFSRQSPEFGPCDTAFVPFAVVSYGSASGSSVSLFSPMTSSTISIHIRSFSSAPPPSVSVVCSTATSVDTIPPQVYSTYPPDSATDVPDTTTITITFTEPIDTATFNLATVSVSPVDSYDPFCVSSMTCKITHTPFAAGTTITVSLNSGITDTAGNGLVPYTFSFRTASLLPAGSLYVALTSPDSGEINVPLNANIGVWFSDRVRTSTVNDGSIHIRGWDGHSIRTYSFSVTCPTDLFCVLDPSPLFRPSEVVTVEFTDSIKAQAGGGSLTPKVITFRTQELDTLRPVVVFTIPDSGATGVPTNTNVGVQFSRDMDTTTLAGNLTVTGSISGTHGYSYHCPTADYCTIDPYPDFAVGEEVQVEFTDDILDTDGRRLVPRTVTFTVGGGEDNTPPTVSIISPPNDTIELYNAGEVIRAYVSDPGGIQRVDWVLLDRTYSKPTNCNGSLYTDPDTSCLAMPDVPSGIYLLKAFAYDRSSNIGYDSVWVVFNDTVRPYLLLTEPSDGDVGVSPHTDIRLVFSENMDTATFGSIRIRVGSDTYAYDHLWESRSILRLDPSSPFPYDSVVKVEVSSFADLSGNTMLPDSFSFRIVSNASVSATIISVSPDTVYVGSGDSVEVVGVVLSTYPITGAEVLLDGDTSLEMLAIDGGYDEVEETVAVKIYTEKEGVHTVVIRGHNAYDYGVSPAANFYVLKVPFLSKDNVVVYPNPTKGKAKVRFVLGDDAYATVEVFDLKARKVFSVSRMFKGFVRHEIVLPQLPPGLYLLRVRARGQKVERWFSVVR